MYKGIIEYMIKSIKIILIIFFIFQLLQLQISQIDNNGYNPFRDETLQFYFKFLILLVPPKDQSGFRD